MATSSPRSSWTPGPPVRLRRAEGVFQPGHIYIQIDGPPVNVFDREVGHGFEKGAFDRAKQAGPGVLPLTVEHHGPRIGTLVELRELPGRMLSIWKLEDPSWQWFAEMHPEVSFLLSPESRSHYRDGIRAFSDVVLEHAALVAWGGRWRERHKVVELSRTFDPPSAPGRSHGARQAAGMGWRDTQPSGTVKVGRLPEPDTSSPRRRARGAGSSADAFGWRDTPPVGPVQVR